MEKCPEQLAVVAKSKSSDRMDSPLEGSQKDLLGWKKSCRYVDNLTEEEHIMVKLREECELVVHIVGVNSNVANGIGLLAVATKEQCIIFDMKTVGDTVFNAGLREIFESHSIVKVTHNCRVLSDYLSQHYSIKLESVFDIEIAYMMYSLGRCEDVREQTPKLCEIYQAMLGKCFPENCDNNDEEAWFQRPLGRDRQTVIFKYLEIMLPLKEKLTQTVDCELVLRCVEFYLNDVSTDTALQVVRAYKGKLPNFPDRNAGKLTPERNNQGSSSSSFTDTSEDEATPTRHRKTTALESKEVSKNLNESIKSYGETFSPEIYDKVMEFSRQMIEKSVYVDNLDNAEDAMKNIIEEPVIALEMIGANSGFLHKVGLLSVATSAQAYVFDVKIVGESLFDSGLRKALESEEIVKVIHNCRMLSDILYNRYRVSLSNVFDTEVAYVLKTAEEHKRVINIAPDLRRIFNSVSPIPVTGKYGPKTHPLGLAWMKRPLSVEFQYFAARNVVHLIYLRELLIPFINNEELMKQCVDCYLASIRDLDRAAAEHCLGKIFTVPKELYHIVKGSMPSIVADGWEERVNLPNDDELSTKRRRLSNCLIS